MLETCAIPLTSAFMIGFLGSTHCVGMCGGITAALDFALPMDASTSRKWFYRVLYSLGRLLSYTIAGMLVGTLGAGTYATLGDISSQWMRIVAGVFMILLGISLTGWLNLLKPIESAGARVWKLLSPLQKRLFPINHPGKALAMGALWGWLPCGLVYSTLVWSLASAAPLQGGLVMLAFGAGTLPAVLLMGHMAQWVKKASQSSWLRSLAGVLIIGFGLWTIIPATQHLTGGHDHGSHNMPGHSHETTPQSSHEPSPQTEEN